MRSWRGAIGRTRRAGDLPPYRAFVAGLFGLILLIASSAGARQQPPAPPPALPADAERISENLYRVGRAVVDLKARTVTCEGEVNLRKGVIEYLAVAERGKRHESILLVQVQPLHLQVGLILLGLEPKGGLSVQGDRAEPKGPPVDVWVRWRSRGKDVRHRAEELVWDLRGERVMGADPWIFSGSVIDEKGFVADRERSLIATYRDPAAIVNNRLPSGADDAIYEANEKLVPPVGTRVELVVQAREPR